MHKYFPFPTKCPVIFHLVSLIGYFSIQFMVEKYGHIFQSRIIDYYIQVFYLHYTKNTSPSNKKVEFHISWISNGKVSCYVNMYDSEKNMWLPNYPSTYKEIASHQMLIKYGIKSQYNNFKPHLHHQTKSHFLYFTKKDST